MTETGRLEVSDKDRGCLYHWLFLQIFTIMGFAALVWLLTEWELDCWTILSVCVFALHVAFNIWLLRVCFKWTTTTFDRSTANVEIRKYSLGCRNPEPRIIPWSEIRDVLVIPRSPCTCDPTFYVPWLLLRDRSLLCLYFFGSKEQVVGQRDRVASFLGLSGSERLTREE